MPLAIQIALSIVGGDESRESFLFALTVILEGDSASVTLYLSHAGIYPIRPRRILATGTDATNIVALY